MLSVNQISEPYVSINSPGLGKNILFHCVVRSHLEVINPVMLSILSITEIII